MTAPIVGPALGGLAATGAILAIAGSPPMCRVRLEDRIAPHLRTLSRATLVDSAATPLSVARRLLAPLLDDLAHRVDTWLGGGAGLRRRLDASGSELTVEQFRVEQVIWAGLGLAFGLVLVVAAAARGSRATPVAFLVLAVVFAIAGAMARDRRLTTAVTRRQAQVAAEFPTVADLLALAVGAGESPVAAVRRISCQASGPLADELRRVVAEVAAGKQLVDALESMAARTEVPALARFVDGLAVAVERGTPLADVLRAQAADARDEGRRALLDAGGRKEIAMLIPVVFFVLPVTVVFALYPGFASLRLAAP